MFYVLKKQYGSLPVQKLLPLSVLVFISFAACFSVAVPKAVDDSSLHRAVEIGDALKISFLLDDGANIFAKDQYGWTVLHTAAFHQQAQVVEILLEQAGWQQLKLIRATTKRAKKQAIHMAATSGNLEIIEMLIAKDEYSVQAVDAHKKTPLHYAVEYGHTRAVEFFIAQGANVNAQDILGRTPMHYAVVQLYDYETEEYGHINIVKALLSQKDIDVNARDKEKKAPLHLAVQYESTFLLMPELLAHEDIDVNAKDGRKQTPLHLAVQKNSIRHVRSLLAQENIDIYAQDSMHQTALNIAEESGRTEIAELLKQAQMARPQLQNPAAQLKPPNLYERLLGPVFAPVEICRMAIQNLNSTFRNN